MESRVKALGHPIHPMLIVLPLGAFISAIIFDIIFLIWRLPFFAPAAFYCIAVGVVGGLLSALFGFIDWLSVPSGTRAKRVGGWHGIGNVVLVVFFAISWLLRLSSQQYVPSTLALIFSFAGIILGLFTAWAGGEMVYRLDVSVDPGANLDAPSSLSGEPAGPYPSVVVPVTGSHMPEHDTSPATDTTPVPGNPPDKDEP